MKPAASKHTFVWIWLFFALLAMALVSPIGSETFVRNLADYINHIMITIQAGAALAEGQFPIRTAPLEAAGYGYPIYQFYSPSAYTLTGLLYDSVSHANPLIAIKFSVWLCLWLGGVFFYRLSYAIVASIPAALLASVVYLSSPYYIIVLSRFGDVTESMALGIVPVVLYYTAQRYLTPNKPNTLLKASLAWYILMTTHIVTFIQTSLFVALFLIIITYQHRRHVQHCIQVGIAYALACLMGMWFFAPLALVSNLLTVTNTFTLSTDFIDFHLLLSYLFFSGASVTRHLVSGLQSYHPSLGWPILLAVCTCLALSANKLGSLRKRTRILLNPLLFLFGIAFVMVCSPFNFWKFLPHAFMVGQYTWRYLEQVIALGAVLFAIGITYLFQHKLDARHTVIGLILVVTATCIWYPLFDKNSATLAEITQKPGLIYSQNAYLIDASKHTEIVNTIDTMQLKSLMLEDRLQWGMSYHMPLALLKLTQNPKLTLTGGILNKTNDPHVQLAFLINNAIVATHPMTPGTLHWVISLSDLLPKDTSLQTFHFKFATLRDHKIISSQEIIPITTLELSGFLKADETLGLAQTKPRCKRIKAETICHFQTKPSINLVELPTLYYPQLLHITLNGKPIRYSSVLKSDYLITGIQPVTGDNTVRIQFLGLPWANWVSRFAWLLWCFILLRSNVKPLFSRIKSFLS